MKAYRFVSNYKKIGSPMKTACWPTFRWKSPLWLPLLGALALGVGFTAVAPAQISDRSQSKVLAAFRDTVKTPALSTVRIYSEGRRAALGAVVRSDGYVVTKASELRGELECQLFSGKRLPAQLLARDSALDLAVLKIEAQNLPEVRWAEADPPVGSLLATPGLERDPVAIGVVSVGRRKIPKPPAALGVQLDEVDSPAKIIRVIPDSAAQKAGVENEDIVLQVNDKKIASRRELVETIRNFMPGDRVKLLIQRGTEQKTLEAVLGGIHQIFEGEDRAEFQNNLGGPLSERRAGFDAALQHDTILRPYDCGGPLVNLDGAAIGLNIARAGRVESYAIPADVVKQAVQRMVPAPAPATPAAPAKLADRPTAGEPPPKSAQ